MIPKIIKVCGLTHTSNIRKIENIGADWIGLILWNGSVRYISPETAEKIITYRQRLQSNTKNTAFVGVFVNEAQDEILRWTEKKLFDIIQLHGKESSDFCFRIQEQIQKEQQKTIPIIKAFAIATPKDLTETKNFETCCDYFLFDTKSSLPGGNGISFDWNILNDYTGNIPFLISGGIRPTDIEKILSFQHPACIGIDINSQFEIYPGEKDTEKIKKFIQSLRSVKSNKLPII